MLRFEHVSLSYGSQQILDDLSFEIQEGQMAVLIGPSGCGKTTTLKMINRLIEPTAGRIYLDGQDITTKDKVELRRHIGYVIQQIGLFPNMTVAQNISVVPTLLKYSREECDRIVRELLDMVNLPYEQYAHKYPSEMSGGQQQRIGILRALAASPPIVLMDEPFSALDSYLKYQLELELAETLGGFPGTVLWVSHDRGEVFRNCRRVCVIDRGRSQPVTTLGELFRSPGTEAGCPALRLQELCRRPAKGGCGVSSGLGTDALLRPSGAGGRLPDRHPGPPCSAGRSRGGKRLLLHGSKGGGGRVFHHRAAAAGGRGAGGAPAADGAGQGQLAGGAGQGPPHRLRSAGGHSAAGIVKE